MIGTSTQAEEMAKELFHIQQSIQTEVDQLIKGFDPRGQAYVRVQPKTTSLKLPSTPFTYETKSIRGPNGKLQLGAVEVKIISYTKQIPQEILNVIKDIVSYYDAKPIFTITNLSQKIRPTYKKAKAASKNKDLVEAIVKGIQAGINLKGLQNNQNNQNSQNASNKGFSFSINTDQESAALIANYLPSGIVLILFSLILFTALILRQTTKKNDEFQSMFMKGINQITSALADRNEVLVPVEMTEEPPQEISKVQPQQRLKHNSPLTEAKFIESMDKESLSALITDCYWGHYDAYAAYIWSNIPVQKRKNIISNIPFVEKYASYICELNPINLGFHQEPYYINPLPLSELNNEDLSTLTRNLKGLIHKLPTMRIEKSKLTAKELYELNQGSELEVDIRELASALKRIHSSERRSLNHKMKFQIRSISDESDILSIKDLSYEDKVNIPSLGWLLDLRGDKIKEILNPYSAEELATAWLGPKEILDKLSKYIPWTKYEKLIHVLQNVTPNRDAPIFHQIHQKTLAALEEKISDDLLKGSQQA